MAVGYSNFVKSGGLGELLAGLSLRDYVLGQASKAQSLQKLGRLDEAKLLIETIEREILAHSQTHQTGPHAMALYAALYSECGPTNKLRQVLRAMLDSPGFSEEQKFVIGGMLQNADRHQAADLKSPDQPPGFTQIYCCRACGRFHNYLSMPCLYCDWLPETLSEVAESTLLSNAFMGVPDLIEIGRSLAIGRAAGDIVPNLRVSVDAFLETPSNVDASTLVLSLGKENAHKNHRSLVELTSCQVCGVGVLFSAIERCHKCDTPLSLPPAVIAVACFEALIRAFQFKLPISSNQAVSELICCLVRMTNNLVRKQESPSEIERQYSLKLLTKIGTVADSSGGAVVDFADTSNVRLYLVKQALTDEAEGFGLLLRAEVEQFVLLMNDGVKG